MSDAQQKMCSECGGLEGRIQHVDIAWPGREPYYSNVAPHFVLNAEFVPNPKADGKCVTLWLHPGCERNTIERLEKEFRYDND